MTAALRRVLAAAVLAVVALCAVPAVQAATLTFPALSGRVVDEAGVLPADARATLDAKLADLEAKTSRQLVVVTLKSLQGDEVEDYGYRLGRAWGIGQGKLNNGVLFIVAPAEHKTRIEVGYGLEPILTDALSSVILQDAVLPRFRAGDVPGGITAGADALIQQLSLDPSAAEQKAAEAAQARDQQVATTSSHRRHGFPFGVFFNVVILLVVFRALFRRRRGGLGAAWPLFFLGGGGGGWGGGGGNGGGGGGGGGFSGGGGSFGGGGASGSW